MNEASARETTLLQAFETVRPPSSDWRDEDRVWADRVAVEELAADTPAEAFLAGRSRNAMQRLAPRDAAARLATARSPWRARWAASGALLGFVLGLLADSIGPSQRINLLAPPLWGVLAWNGLVYLLLLGAWIVAAVRRGPRPMGPLVRGVRSVLRIGTPAPKAGGTAGAMGEYARLWTARTATISFLRAETVLHIGAATLALGLIAGFYARGLVLDYRAVWESTFLSAQGAHALVAGVLAPASALSGIALPGAVGFASLEAVQGGSNAGAPAAPWIHLFALTLLLFVVLPRALLALLSATGARRRSRDFDLPLGEPYFQRLLRLRGGAVARVEVWPYAVTLSAESTGSLQAIVAEALGPRATVRMAPATAFGSEEDTPYDVAADTSHAIAWFDLAATPEAENQGRFVELLAAALPAGAGVAILVDETTFGRRFAATPQRIAQRRDAWRGFAESLGTAPAFADLGTPDLATAETALQAALAAPARKRSLPERPMAPA